MSKHLDRILNLLTETPISSKDMMKLYNITIKTGHRVNYEQVNRIFNKLAAENKINKIKNVFNGKAFYFKK